MQKTLLVSLLLALGPVAASAGAMGANDTGLVSKLDMACALQQSECGVIERRVSMR